MTEEAVNVGGVLVPKSVATAANVKYVSVSSSPSTSSSSSPSSGQISSGLSYSLPSSSSSSSPTSSSKSFSSTVSKASQTAINTGYASGTPSFTKSVSQSSQTAIDQGLASGQTTVSKQISQSSQNAITQNLASGSKTTYIQPLTQTTQPLTPVVSQTSSVSNTSQIPDYLKSEGYSQIDPTGKYYQKISINEFGNTQIIEKPIFDESTAKNTVGEAIQRGYIIQKGADEFQFVQNVPDSIRKSIEEKIKKQGYKLSGDSTFKLQKDINEEPTIQTTQQSPFELSAKTLDFNYDQNQQLKLNYKNADIQPITSSNIEILTPNQVIEEQPKSEFQIERERYAKIPILKELTTIPFFGETIITTKVGLEDIQQGLYSGDTKRIEKGLPAFGFGVGSAALGGYALGETIGAGLGGIALKELGLIGVKTIGQNVAFSGLVKIGGETYSSFTESRPFDIDKANLGELAGEIAKPEFLATSYLVGIGSGAVANRVFPVLGKTLTSEYAQQIGTGIISGGVAGGAFATTSKTDDKQLIPQAIAGAALGGLAGAGNVFLESQGIKPVFEEQRVSVFSKSGERTDQILGVKIGVEKINTQTGEMKFYGYANKGKVVASENSIIIPKGVVETQLYTPELKTFYQTEAKAYFSTKDISGKILKERLTQVTAEKTPTFLQTMKETGGVIGGSSVERSLIGTKGLNIEQPSARTQQAKDIDVAYYFDETSPQILAKKLGAPITKEKTPLSTKGFVDTTEKYKITLQNDKSLDISVTRPSVFNAPQVTPLGQYQSSSSYSNVEGIVTYSPKQQIATKFMTIGTKSGKLTTIESGKEKYLSDINAIAEMVGDKTLINIPKNLNSKTTNIAVSNVPRTISNYKPSGQKPSTSVSRTQKPSISISKQKSLTSSKPSPVKISILTLSTYKPSEQKPSILRNQKPPTSISPPSRQKPSSSPPSISKPSSPSSQSISESSSPSSESFTLPSPSFPVALGGFIPPFGSGGGGEGVGAVGSKTNIKGRVRDLVSIYKSIEPRKNIKVSRPKIAPIRRGKK